MAPETVSSPHRNSDIAPIPTPQYKPSTDKAGRIRAEYLFRICRIAPSIPGSRASWCFQHTHPLEISIIQLDGK
jgi:hypothetical protein